jgi:prolipoprotein diacylglyceryltransferase
MTNWYSCTVGELLNHTCSGTVIILSILSCVMVLCGILLLWYNKKYLQEKGVLKR